MTLTQYLRVLRQQWLVVGLLALLGLGGAAAYTYRQVPMYSASTQLFVSARTPDSDISQLSQGSSFSQQRVKSYTDIVGNPMIAQAVIAQLNLPLTPAQLSGEISASSPLDTVLLDVSVSDSDPSRAAAIANAVADQFPRVVARLETPAGRTVSPVKVSVTRQAVVPGAPVSPRIPLNLMLGLIVGLGLGIGAAVLRDQFNTTVGGIGDIERLTGAIPLGVVPYDAAAVKQPLVTADQFGGRAEAFRTLRTNLQFADVDDPPRVITVTSALPAEGKTTTACNIALTLAQSGARVVLVEGDLRKPAVGKYLGISNAAGLTNVLAGQHELRDVIVSYQRDTLAVLPSGPTPPNPSEMLGSQQMHHLLASLANHYDLVIIDAPPLLPVTDAAVLAAAADGAILVVRHGRSRREEVERALQALSSVNAKVLGTVLNFAPRKKRRGGYDGYGYGYGYGYGPAVGPATGAPGGSDGSDGSGSSSDSDDSRDGALLENGSSGTGFADAAFPGASGSDPREPATSGSRAGASRSSSNQSSSSRGSSSRGSSSPSSSSQSSSSQSSSSRGSRGSRSSRRGRSKQDAGGSAGRSQARETTAAPRSITLPPAPDAAFPVPASPAAQPTMPAMPAMPAMQAVQAVSEPESADSRQVSPFQPVTPVTESPQGFQSLPSLQAPSPVEQAYAAHATSRTLQVPPAPTTAFEAPPAQVLASQVPSSQVPSSQVPAGQVFARATPVFQPPPASVFQSPPERTRPAAAEPARPASSGFFTGPASTALPVWPSVEKTDDPTQPIGAVRTVHTNAAAHSDGLPHPSGLIHPNGTADPNGTAHPNGTAQPTPQAAQFGHATPPQPEAMAGPHGTAHSPGVSRAGLSSAFPHLDDPENAPVLLDLAAEDRERRIPPQPGPPVTGTGVPRHHRSKRSL